MLPDILFSSYQRYKEDTNVFTTWLAQAARSCGYKAPELEKKAPIPSEAAPNVVAAAPRLKGRARKEAKAAAATNNTPTPKAPDPLPVPVAKYKLTTKHLLEQARAVAKSMKPKVQLPADILKVVERAIHARQRCAAWFEETKSKNVASTEGHAHFIAVLQQALNILQPCYDSKEINTTKPSNGKTLTSKKMSGSSQTFDDDLSNRFGNLHVEELDESLDITTTNINQAVKKIPQAKAKVEYEEVYELIDEFNIDISFTIFCFFEDLHRIQDFLKQTWTMYGKKELDLMTCAMTTNIALDMIRRAEEDIIDQASTLLKKPRSYEAIATIIFFAESFAKGENPEEAFASSERLKITPFDEFIYLSTARILIKFEQIAAMKIAYPQPVPSVRFSYISRPDLLDLPQVKKWEEEDEFLTQLLMELSFNDNILKAQEQLSGQKAPMSDEITRGFYELRRRGEFIDSVWIVFAARILLDIRDIVGKDIPRGYLEQKAAGDQALALLDFKVEHGQLNPRGERWRTKDAPHILALWKLLKYWVTTPTLPLMKQRWLAEKANVVDQYMSFDELPPEHQEQVRKQAQATGAEIRPPKHLVKNVEKIGLRPIKHAAEPDFLLTHNPIATGTLEFIVALGMEHAGTTLASHHHSIFAIAHLYNAIRQCGTVDLSWPDMDKIIETQISVIFAGELPTTPRTFHTRFALQMGFSAKNFARNQRLNNGPIFAPGKQDGPQMSDTQTSKILDDYVRGNTPMASSIYRLEAMIQDSERSKNTDKRVIKRHFTPIEVLGQVRQSLSATMPQIQIDYISMTRTCNKLLREIHVKLESELEIEHQLIRSGDTNQPGYLIMTLAVLDEVSKAQILQDNIFKSPGMRSGGPQLDVCAEVLKQFLN